MRCSLLPGIVCAVALVVQIKAVPAESEAGWQPISVSNLVGWSAPDQWWSEQDDVIVAESKGGESLPGVHHLFWDGRLTGDFELRLEYRIISKVPQDAGVYFRVQRELGVNRKNNLIGYQAELDTAHLYSTNGTQRNGKLFGNIFDGKRHRMLWRGKRVEFDVDGNESVTPLSRPFHAPRVFRKPPEWNRCLIRTQADLIQLYLNDRLANEIVDRDRDKRSTGDAVAFQFRPRGAYRFEVRNLEFRQPNPAPGQPRPAPSLQQVSVLVESGDPAAAIRMLDDLFATDPSTMNGLRLATLYAVTGQKDKHRQFCARFEQEFSDWKRPSDAERPAKAYLLFPGASDTAMLKKADAATRHAVEKGRGGMRVWFELSRGMARYRLGDYSGAVSSLRSPLRGTHPMQRVQAHAFAAMAAHHLGQAGKAGRMLDAAKSELNSADRSELNWNDVLASELFIEEAETLINHRVSTSDDTNDTEQTEILHVYGKVPGLNPSDQYRFRVRAADGSWQEPFAFITTCKQGDGKKTNNYFDHLSGWSNTYINFEMGGRVEIAISKVNGENIRKAAAHPRHRVVSCRVRKGIAYVVMKEPGLVAIDIDGQMDDQDTGKGYRGPPIHTVTVFANPFLKDRPQPDSPSVHYVKPGEKAPHTGPWQTLCFLPGVHDIGVGYPLRSNTDYYIPGDAIVYGTMNNLADRSQGRNIRIFGHGTLSGARIAHPRYASPRPEDEKMHNAIRILDASNTTVEGITLADSASHSLQMLNWKNQDALTELRWAKVFTWRGNGDGMGAGANGLMEDCFMRCQDDCTYVMAGRPIRRVTFWNDYNGSAFVLSGLPNSEKIVEDCDVIYARAGWHHWNGGRVFNMRGLGGGACGNGVVFRNIRVSDPRPTLQHFFIAMEGLKPYGKIRKRGDGDMSGVLFQDIRITAPSVLGEPELLWGMPDGQIRNLTFDNVTIGGRRLTSIRQFKHNSHVRDLRFR